MKKDKSGELFILWTTENILTSEKMVIMYATNSKLKQWWQEVTVIVWGAAPKLAAENEAIQEKIKIAQNAGVRFSACKACADQLGATDKLLGLGIDVIYWGEGLTQILREGNKLLTV